MDYREELIDCIIAANRITYLDYTKLILVGSGCTYSVTQNKKGKYCLSIVGSSVSRQIKDIKCFVEAYSCNISKFKLYYDDVLITKENIHLYVI